jgi:hypothetical protein
MSMRFGSPIDMAKTADDVKKETADYAMPATSSGKPSVPLYSYRHCISFNEEDLAKLGMEMPTRGETVHFVISAKVTAVSETEREDTDGKVTQCQNVEMQIMTFRPEVDEILEMEEEGKERRKRFYDDDGRTAPGAPVSEDI